ncbi:MAG: hypothetical protein ACI87W_001904 [Halieaceae bacterium]|jgi:hypothetical protein
MITQATNDKLQTVEALLRATPPTRDSLARWDRRLTILISADARRYRARLTVATLLALLTGCAAPLGLAIFSGSILPPSLVFLLAIGVIGTLLCLPPAAVWRALEQARCQRLLRRLHVAGVSATRDAQTWILRDRSNQAVLASAARPGPTSRFSVPAGRTTA